MVEIAIRPGVRGFPIRFMYDLPNGSAHRRARMAEGWLQNRIVRANRAAKTVPRRGQTPSASVLAC
jgi:hypothetical protein